ncbi:MAG: OsmC family protein [Candidatus Helarchaeota archaeon]
MKQNPKVGKVTNRVRVIWEGNFKAKAKVGNHKLIFDEGQMIGGTDAGPSPAGTFLAAIGGCEIATCTFWASQLDVKIESLDITVKGKLDVNGMLGTTDAKPGFEKITIKIKIKSPDPPEKINELIEKMEKHCPVLNSIITPPKLEVSHQQVNS